jgi:hypothetical protein
MFAQRAILLHGPSGVGKSSLVHAGLLPRARERGFEFVPVARVRDTTLDVDGALAGNRYVHNVVENWREMGMEVPPGQPTLLDVLRSLPPAEEPGRVVVFDQFEEIFVVHPECWKDRADLLLQVQAALDADPLLHVVFVLRDDYLARLQPLTPVLRDRLSTRYHLRGLSGVQALDAVAGPFAAAGRTFAAGVAEELVRAIRTQPGVAPESRGYEAEDVEPVQLQIVCRTFFDRLPPGVVEIATADVERHADVNQALVGFYEQALAAAVKRHPRVGERKVRLWFERELITPARTRGIVFRDTRTTAGLSNDVVDELEDQRVVRSEPRGSAIWYELPHDRLVDPVLNSNRSWFAKRGRTITRLSAAVGLLSVVIAVVSVVLVTRGGDEAASAPQDYEIGAPGAVVRRTLTGRAGQQLTAVMVPSSFTGELRLLDSQGAVVAQTTGVDYTAVVLNREIPADGGYILEARGVGKEYGGFQLAFTTQTVDVSGATLTDGRPVPGEIGAPDEVDVFTVAGPPGAVAQITAVGDSSLPLQLVATAPNRPAIVDRRSSGQAMLAFVIPPEGTYEVRVSPAEEATGTYRLELELHSAEPAPPEVTGVLDARNRADVWPVRSDTGGVLDASLSSAPYSGLVLLAADGRRLTDVSIQEAESESGFQWPMAPGATYLVVPTWNGSEGGEYVLTDTTAEARPLLDGGGTAELSETDQLAAFRLDGGPADVSISVEPQNELDVAVIVLQPDGTALVVIDDGGLGDDELFSVRLQQAGPHVIVVGTDASEGRTGTVDVAVTERS